MHPFSYQRAAAIEDAVRAASATPATGATSAGQPARVRFLAGGTTLIDLMKLDVEQPERVIDINHLPLDQVEVLPDGGLRIGALVRNADLAREAVVARDYAVLSQALLAGASAQLRNMATTGGNLLQRTRCVYFRDPASACNKRVPGSGCPAIGGYHRNLAILGTSPHCIASNPSDMNVALMVLDARVDIVGTQDRRSVPVGEFFTLPGETPHVETIMRPGDLITHVTLPAPPSGSRSVYLKLRDRASYEFALVSAAVVLTLADDGSIEHVRVALGGVGTRPWRAPEAEDVLRGQAPGEAVFHAAADAALHAAKPGPANGFKVELARRCLVHALHQAVGRGPASAAANVTN